MLPLRRSTGATGLLLLLAAVLAFAPTAHGAEAQPSHPFLSSLHGEIKEHVPIPPPEGELEDVCGVAVDSAGDLYVSDYYHHQVDVYGPTHKYLTQIADPDPDGPCNLAVDSAGNVYVNNWRRDVVRFVPSEFPPTEVTRYGSEAVIDFPTAPGARSTGVFLDPASGDLYVDDRTYVAVYGADSLAEPEPEPQRTFGLGALRQGYGIAVSDFPATEGEVYVPDAVGNVVEVFDPAGSPAGEIDGAGTPQHGFRSLLDSDVAVDPTDGHVFVADDTEPGFESPAAVVDEFNAAGDYRGQLPHAIVDAEPSALAVNAAGRVYVTSGNSEGAALYEFGPTVPAHTLVVTKTGTGGGAVTSEPAGIACGTACAAEYNVGEEVTLAAVPGSGSTFAGWSGCDRVTGMSCTVTISADRSVSAEFGPLPPVPLSLGGATGTDLAVTAAAPPGSATSRPRTPLAGASEIVQKGTLRVAFSGRLAPRALPRHGAAPVSVGVGGRITTTDHSDPPQLRKIRIAINRNGRFDYEGLASCTLREIQPSTTANALAACGAAKVGEGSFEADVKLPQQSPFPSKGKLVAFNGIEGGHHVIFAHVYGTDPVPTSYTLPLQIANSKGTFGTILTAALPRITSKVGFVTGISLTLSRRFTAHGKRHSYLSAGCPAPKGFPGAVFPLARASFGFAAGVTLAQTLTSSCRATG